MHSGIPSGLRPCPAAPPAALSVPNVTRRTTRAVSAAATLSDAIAPLRADPSKAGVLLDIDGVLAPIVRHADDAHVPEPTRVPLIAVAKRYGLVACVSGRQATTARRIVSLGSITYVGNHGAELLRGGKTDVELDPEVAKWAPRVREFAEDGVERPAAPPARARRGQGRHPRLPLARRPRRGRGRAGGARDRRSAPRRPGSSPTGAARSSRSARRSSSTRAAACAA